MPSSARGDDAAYAAQEQPLVDASSTREVGSGLVFCPIEANLSECPVRCGWSFPARYIK